METLAQFLKAIATKASLDLFGEETGLDKKVLQADLTQSTQKHFGHYQFNSPLKLGKLLKKPPIEIASRLAEELKKHENIFEKVEIAGPGFINLTLKNTLLETRINEQLKDPLLGAFRPKEKQKIVVEYSSPNIAKELHVGHLRSTIIGESLARLFEFLGHDVLRLNHVGDWGTQFGMLIAYLKKFHQDVLKGAKDFDLSELMQAYKEAKKLFDADKNFKKSSQIEVVNLQAKNLQSLSAWEKICDISREAFQKIYDILDVSLKERGESFYNSDLENIVQELQRLGLAKEDEGAICVFLDGFFGKDKKPLPMIVKKSDGGYNYSTTDLAAIKQRATVEQANRIIYVVDAGQSLHFQMVFKAAEKAGFIDPKKTKAEHVAFGVVLGSDGKKFKTRSGETEKLIDLLTKSVEKAKDILKERDGNIADETLNTSAEILGIDAIKYADLSCHRLKDYVFSYDRMLKFEGNTAAFLLYAYVRINSIERKISKDPKQLEKEMIKLSHLSEVNLALHLLRFGEALEMVDRELLPNRLSDYLYHLAENFHGFFRDCRVEGTHEEASRLLLCQLTKKVLKKGLYILGLKTLEKM